MNRLACSRYSRVSCPEADGIAQNGITQRAAQAVEDRCAQQERLDACGLLLQDFFNQIVQHEMVAAGERFDEAGGVLMSLHRNRGQLQPGNPAFGAGFQGGDVFRREVEAHHLVEKSGGFGGGKAQVGGAQFGQLARGAQPGQGELRILTGGDDQVHLRRQVLEQKGEGMCQPVWHQSRGSRQGPGRNVSGMVVISLSRAVSIDSVGGGCGDWSTPSTPSPICRRNRLQSSDEVGQKACGVVIPFVQRQPGHRPVATGDPFADQRGFAEAGGGGDEGQFAVQPLVQPLDQAGAKNNLRPRAGDVKFSG